MDSAIRSAISTTPATSVASRSSPVQYSSRVAAQAPDRLAPPSEGDYQPEPAEHGQRDEAVAEIASDPEGHEAADAEEQGERRQKTSRHASSAASPNVSPE